jgi:2-dehydropantoate 2-reductase
MNTGSAPTEVLVVGPGAIGCAFAACAMTAGRTVRFAGPTPFSRLDVETPDGDVGAEVEVATDPADVRPAPLVLLATKAHQSEAALDFLRAGLADGGVLGVLQNGVTHVARMRSLLDSSLPGAPIAPAVVYCPAERTGPGRVTVTGHSRLTVPDDDAGRTVAAALAGGHGEVRVSDDWLTAAWTKLMMNTATGAVAVLARRDNRVFHDAEAGVLALAIMEEVAAVARAEGAVMADDLPARALVVLREGASDHMSSIVVDRLAGRATEWRERNLVVVELARHHGIDVPVNRLTTTLLRLGEPGAAGDRGVPSES